MDPAGRHALVTGGGRGIGAAIARALTAAGAVVTVLGRNPAPLAAMLAEGDAAGFAQADVTDAAALAAAVARAEAARGPLSILVNNAGAVETAPFGKLQRDAWDRMIAVNLTAVYQATQAVLPGLLAGGWGRIVNVASTAGLTGYPYVAAYVAAKHGVVGLTRALALETAKSGVTVNAVCPGYTETDLLADSMAKVVAKTGKTEQEVRATFARSNPQGRLVAPEEVAAAVLFLCGPASGAMTGQAIAVAGGEVM
ncbi:SDR family oxidoreductase [Rhodovastum sp. RN2-1]|uniref:SDR family oxidoreductase n=2 Tax=Limobrevibacterium gyesilva TaxID=2991712 RepID=A0AA41YLX5_9PROT|nr:SDR family NAD(P)-dependent oxidoreductase [Limobrevibacterium gyesilva]MCW3474373.1 SDR family oxidoreductase [Limobrevibacterium gyesilva]